MTIEILIYISRDNLKGDMDCCITDTCYLISPENYEEIAIRKKDGVQVFTSVDDLEQYCFFAESAINNLIGKGEKYKYYVDWDCNFTFNQNGVFSDIENNDDEIKKIRSHAMRFNKVVEKMLTL